MEQSLDENITTLMNSKSVTGVVISDSSGFCLQARGTLPDESAAVISELARLSSQLEPTSQHKPVISLESDSSYIAIHADGRQTVAVQKTR